MCVFLKSQLQCQITGVRISMRAMAFFRAALLVLLASFLDRVVDSPGTAEGSCGRHAVCLVKEPQLFGVHSVSKQSILTYLQPLDLCFDRVLNPKQGSIRF